MGWVWNVPDDGADVVAVENGALESVVATGAKLGSAAPVIKLNDDWLDEAGAPPNIAVVGVTFDENGSPAANLNAGGAALDDEVGIAFASAGAAADGMDAVFNGAVPPNTNGNDDGAVDESRVASGSSEASAADLAELSVAGAAAAADDNDNGNDDDEEEVVLEDGLPNTNPHDGVEANALGADDDSAAVEVGATSADFVVDDEVAPPNEKAGVATAGTAWPPNVKGDVAEATGWPPNVNTGCFVALSWEAEGVVEDPVAPN